MSLACLEDIDWRASRGLSREVIHAAGQRGLAASWPQCAADRCHRLWQDLAGVCAGSAGAHLGFLVLYVRAPRLLEELHVAHGDGSFGRRLGQLAKLDLLILDDFAIAPIAAHERNDLLELLDDRVGSRSTLIISQLPVTAWHAWLDEPTLADAILDRIVHGSHKMALKGESMRKRVQGA